MLDHNNLIDFINYLEKRVFDGYSKKIGVIDENSGKYILINNTAFSNRLMEFNQKGVVKKINEKIIVGIYNKCRFFLYPEQRITSKSKSTQIIENDYRLFIVKIINFFLLYFDTDLREFCINSEDNSNMINSKKLFIEEVLCYVLITLKQNELCGMPSEYIYNSIKQLKFRYNYEILKNKNITLPVEETLETLSLLHRTWFETESFIENGYINFGKEVEKKIAEKLEIINFIFISNDFGKLKNDVYDRRKQNENYQSFYDKIKGIKNICKISWKSGNLKFLNF